MLTLATIPAVPQAAAADTAQICYVLLTLDAGGQTRALPVSWAFVADASRSMQIPIVTEAVFRELIRSGGAQEVLVDGVPVWQIPSELPPDVLAAAPSALDYVARALHTILERLDGEDRFALIACAEAAVPLARSGSGVDRAGLAAAIGRLRWMDLGEQTDLALGMELGMRELRASYGQHHAARLLLLTDGFTQRPEACLELARAAAAEGVAISTIGVGGEFADGLLTALADVSGGRALFVQEAAAIPRAVAAELAASRAIAARRVTLELTPLGGAQIRRVTRVRPALAPLHDALAAHAVPLALGDLGATPLTLLVELLLPPRAVGRYALLRAMYGAAGESQRVASVEVTHTPTPAALAPTVADAAARAAIGRMQLRAADALRAGDRAGAAQLLAQTAQRLDAIGEPALAALSRAQAEAARRGTASGVDARTIVYETRRLSANG